MEESKHTIITQKLIKPTQLYSLAQGGEMVIDDKWGVKIIKNNDWLNLQILVYDEPPKFKIKKHQVIIKKAVVKKEDYTFKVEGEENLFDVLE